MSSLSQVFTRRNVSEVWEGKGRRGPRSRREQKGLERHKSFFTLMGLMIIGVIQFSCHVPWRPLSSVWQAFISNGKRSVIWEPICSGLCVHLTSEWYALEPPLFPSILLGFSSPFNVRGRSITYITLLNITSCKLIGKNLCCFNRFYCVVFFFLC